MSAGTPIEQLTAHLVVLPLVHGFASARSRLTERRVILLRACCGEHTGWGEAAPVPGHTTEDVDALWERLTGLGIAGLDQATGLLGAAIDQARADLDARCRGLSLWQIIGGDRPVPAGAAIGVDTAGNPDRDRLDAAARAGYRHVKLKVTPATSPEHVGVAMAAHPQISFAVDANGSLGWEHDELLARLDTLGLAYIEQPGAAADLTVHRRLRTRMTTPICLDESAHSPGAIDRIIASDSADIVNLKVGRLGPTRVRQLAARLTVAGIQVRLGGLVETGVGRAHTVALATHPLFSVAGDIAGSDQYFTDDLVRPQWRVRDGILPLPQGPGIGVEVDEDAVAQHSVTTVVLI